ncbi:AsmA family protein [Shewanella waksmanii]|uniref:AsmA family protein n=1 Tax=Shewanella waksmanii TaxID=213783 RepID=UPI00048BF838|nr:AsmA family protein [Shewanella waksmanii]
MKVVKWILVAVLLLFVSLAAYLTLVFDPNDFKPQLVDAVKDKTGRTLTINEDLEWTFFPSVGIKLGGIALSNPQGFDKANMLAVNQVVASVALMPLLSKQVEIEEISLDGLTVNLATYKDGRSSFDGLADSGNAQVEPQPSTPAAESSGIAISSIDIGGINITNTQVETFDQATGVTQTFELASIQLSQFTLDEFAKLSYQFKGQLPDMLVTSEGEGQVKISSDFSEYELTDLKVSNSVSGKSIPQGSMTINLTTDMSVNVTQKMAKLELKSFSAADISASGKVDVNFANKVPNVNAKLDVGPVDLDKLLASTDSTSAQGKEPSQPAGGSQTEPDLRGLKQVNGTFDLTIESVKVSNLTTEKWVMNTNLKNGVLSVSKLTAQLYEGKLQASAKLDGRKKVASYQFNKKITGVQIRPLLIDAAEVDMLAGETNFELSGNGKSLITDNIKRNLNAKGKFAALDGALYGVNIPQMIRDAQAKMSGDFSSSKAEEKKTDFTSLTGSFSIAKGVFSNQDLEMASPLIRLAGKGSANLLSETIDYSLTTSVVGSLEGQGGGGRDALHGVEIPFAISGSFTEPKFALDTDALLDSKIKEETDKLKDSLFKKLGGF